jgi:hypothetical protein
MAQLARATKPSQPHGAWLTLPFDAVVIRIIAASLTGALMDSRCAGMQPHSRGSFGARAEPQPVHLNSYPPRQGRDAASGDDGPPEDAAFTAAIEPPGVRRSFFYANPDLAPVLFASVVFVVTVLTAVSLGLRSHHFAARSSALTLTRGPPRLSRTGERRAVARGAPELRTPCGWPAPAGNRGADNTLRCEAVCD